MKPEIKSLMAGFLLLFTFARPSTQTKVQFFKNRPFGEPIYTLKGNPNSCENLANKLYLPEEVTLIKTDTCVNIYTRSDCEGAYISLDVGNNRILPFYSSNVSVRFRSCDDSSDINRRKMWRDLRLRIYEDKYYQNLLWDISTTPNCETVPGNGLSRASSVISDICVILFSESKCTGEAFRTTNLSVGELGDFNKIVSFVPCDVDDVYEPASKPTQLPITPSGEFKDNITSKDNDKVDVSGLGCQCRCENGLSLTTGILLLIIFFLLLCIFYAFRERICFVLKRSSRRDESMSAEEVTDVATKQWLMEIDELRNKTKE